VAAGSLGTTVEQHALADAVSGYADHARLVGDARRLAESREDRLPECWSGLAAQELLGLPFDGTLLDVCVAIEELGHALAPGPVVSTMLGGVLVRHHGDDALRATVEQGLRDGTVSFAVKGELNRHTVSVTPL